MRNLELAFPEKTDAERASILRGVYSRWAVCSPRFPKFPDYTLENVDRIAVYDGLENYLAARDRGKGVLFMTAHLGGWEIGSFVHSLHGHWLNIVVRDLDNPLLDRWVRQLRTLHGNKTHDKDSYARGLIAAMKHGETVGASDGHQHDSAAGSLRQYFGLPACTAGGIAQVAMHTGAAVVPAFTIWDRSLGKYRIRFEPAIPTICTGTMKPMPWPTPRTTPLLSSRRCGLIPISGSGYTGAGRLVLPANLALLTSKFGASQLSCKAATLLPHTTSNG